MIYIPIIIFYAIFGIGAGIRYIYFLFIDKRKKYDDLIAPNVQSIYNLLLSIIVMGLLLFLVCKFDVHMTHKKLPSIEILMNRMY